MPHTSQIIAIYHVYLISFESLLVLLNQYLALTLMPEKEMAFPDFKNFLGECAPRSPWGGGGRSGLTTPEELQLPTLTP